MEQIASRAWSRSGFLFDDAPYKTERTGIAHITDQNLKGSLSIVPIHHE